MVWVCHLDGVVVEGVFVGWGCLARGEVDAARVWVLGLEVG